MKFPHSHSHSAFIALSPPPPRLFLVWLFLLLASPLPSYHGGVVASPLNSASSSYDVEAPSSGDLRRQQQLGGAIHYSHGSEVEEWKEEEGPVNTASASASASDAENDGTGTDRGEDTELNNNLIPSLPNDDAFAASQANDSAETKQGAFRSKVHSDDDDDDDDSDEDVEENDDNEDGEKDEPSALQDSAIGANEENVTVALTSRPIIGVLSQELSRTLTGAFADSNYTSYIAASYVKFVESAGARVVPVLINQTYEYYEKMFNSTNGLLIPGGAANIYQSGYASAGRILFDLALAARDRGDPEYPIWGTCLGFELLILLANDDEPNLARCWSQNQALPLNLTSEEEWQASRIGQDMPQDIQRVMTEKNSTINFHRWCLTPENYTHYEMDDFWRLLSTNADPDGVEFVSMVEARHQGLAMWGTQFHPEKNMFEWAARYDQIPHDRESVRLGLYFAEFFVEQTRKNMHSFGSREEEEKYLIYNFSPHYTGKEDIDFALVQSYMF